MDLAYGPRYEAFRAEVRAFLERHRDRAPRQGGLRSPEVLAWQRLLLEHGYAARTVPREYGGFGASPDVLETRIIAEEFARAGLPTGLGGQGIWMLVPTLLELGTEEQKRTYIPPTISGEMLWCQGYSEPNAGSDLASITTRGAADGHEWVINGQKIWTSTAQISDMMFALVRTEPDAPKHQGISYLLIPMDTPGITVRPLVQMTGHAGFNEVFFDDVRIPIGNIVGRRGEGWQVANATLRYERGSLADPNAARSRLDELVSLMRNERVAGRTVLDDPVLRDRLARIQSRVLAMQCNDLRVLSSQVNHDAEATLARLIVKLQTTELRHELEALGIDVMGELGLLYGDGPRLRASGSWQQNYMFYLGMIIGGGTSQIQKNIIAERGLGMPREPKLAQAETGGYR
jgi:alkylation response protein AidB-like acyl-CoA dehydrogenase